MSAPIVHIGFHKTGSSWLQRAVFPMARGVAVVPRRVIREAILIPSSRGFDPTAARSHLLGGREGQVVISEEELSGNLHTGGLHGAFQREIAERLHACVPDAQIVVFIRSQTTMLAAAYRQYLKSGGTHCIERFLAPSSAPHKRPGFDLDFLAYDGLISRYESLFGRERVHVYAYEMLAREPAKLVRQLATDLGLDLEPDAISTATVNASYRSGTLSFLRFANRFHDREMPNSSCWVAIPGIYPLLGWLAPKLDRLGFMGRVPELADWLPAARVEALEQRYRESNALIEQSRGLDLRGHGYPLPLERGHT